jgi:hypothetical protein
MKERRLKLFLPTFYYHPSVQTMASSSVRLSRRFQRPQTSVHMSSIRAWSLSGDRVASIESVVAGSGDSTSHCARLEGGAYTGLRIASSNSCRMPEFPKPFAGAHNRRYVVDEELRAVGILKDFPFIDTTSPAGTPSTSFVRVGRGDDKIYHETTVCATRNCGG